MKPPIAGVAPPDLTEATSMVLWPSIARFGLGRLVGRLASIPWGLGRAASLGRLMALLTIPVSLPLYLWRVMPYVCRRYRITNRRIVVEKGLRPVEERAIALDEFDAIEVVVLPGQRWLRAGELVFFRGDEEIFRLSGVQHPETHRQVCLKAHEAYVSVREVLKRQAAVPSGQKR
jgi:hypothetical protein